MKKIIRTLHLWLGLTSGLVVFVISLAGAVYVFEEELNQFFYREQIFAEPQTATVLPLSLLFKKAQAALPDEKLHAAAIKSGPYAYVFTSFEEYKEPGLTFFSQYKHWKSVHVNPYTGEVQGIIDQRLNPIGFFRFLHQQLLLRYDIGHQIVAACTLIFFVMIGTGLVLWWPRKWQQGLVVNTKAGAYVRNYDLHRVGGFYVHLLILIVGGTGLVWSYPWWGKGVVWLLGDRSSEIDARPKPPILGDVVVEAEVIDHVFAAMVSRRPDWTIMYIDQPYAWGGQEKHFSGTVQFKGDSAWTHGDSYLFDPETAAINHQLVHENKTLGEKFRNTIYSIHVGSIFGWPTKILALIVALVAASLPVTGFLIWKHKRRRKIKAVAQQFSFMLLRKRSGVDERRNPESAS